MRLIVLLFFKHFLFIIILSCRWICCKGNAYSFYRKLEKLFGNEPKVEPGGCADFHCIINTRSSTGGVKESGCMCQRPA